MLHSLFKKGGWTPLFLCLLFVVFLFTGNLEAHETNSISPINDLHNLAKDPVWGALLHFNKGNFLIKDPNFLLSWPDISLDNEIIATFDALKLLPQTNVVHAQCRFPGRLKWIRENLVNDIDEFPTVECSDYNEYREKAPADTIKLIFASENISSPSSMMGHSFIVLEGINAKGFLVSHAVSYYTILDSYNIPKLITESLFTGMTGLFSLTPYQQLKKRYLENEGRNIWEYELNVSETEKALIHAHIWELKGIKSDYYFHLYNCATLTNFIIATVAPKILTHSRLWISPSDVVKDVKELGLIQKSEMTPSSRWKIKMFIDQMKADQVSNVYSAVQNTTTIAYFNLLEPKDRFLSSQLYETYAFYLEKIQEVNAERKITLHDNISKMNDVSFNDLRLDLSAYKNPIKTPDDTQLSISYGRVEGRNFFQFSFLPTAHRLQDDNRQYFTENELRLGDIKLRYLPDDQSIKLQELTLYSVKTMNPWDRFTGGFSAQWKIGSEPHYSDKMEMHQALNLDASFGMAWAPHPDTILYGMLGAGYGYGAGNNYVYSSPEVGIVINELFNLKSAIKTRYIYNQLASRSGYWDIEFTQSWFFSQRYAMFFNSRLRTNREERELTTDISGTVYF